MFGGSGTIAYEAANLGAEAYSADTNQLATFIQKCTLVYSQCKERESLPRLVEGAGVSVLKRLAADSSPLFPLRETDTDSSPVCYLWTYSTTCEACGYTFYLSKRPWLSRKNGASTGLVVDDSGVKQRVSIQNVDAAYVWDSVWVGKNGIVRCPKCGALHQEMKIGSCTDELVAIIKARARGGKEFVLAPTDAIVPTQILLKMQDELLDELRIDLPASNLPAWSGIVNPALYGMGTHADLLNLRQRVVLLLLVRSLRIEYEVLRQHHGKELADCVVAFLSSLIDQMVDWNCRLSMWISQNEQVGRAFCGPGIAMLWDYAETDPVLQGPANLWAKLKRIVNAIRLIPTFPLKPHIRQASADSLPFADDFFDAIVTDPPYYDNLYYSVLADFFYSWKRLVLAKLEPKLFTSPATDSSRELVASTCRNGNSTRAHTKYCEQLAQAIKEAARVLKPDGIMSFVFSHSSIKAWEAFVRAFRASSFVISSVQPLSIERRQRPRSMTSSAVNTCLAFIARKNTDSPKREMSRHDLATLFASVVDGSFGQSLQAAGWEEGDIGIALYAHGVAMLSNVSSVIGASSDVEILTQFELLVRQRFPGFRMQKRSSL